MALDVDGFSHTNNKIGEWWSADFEGSKSYPVTSVFIKNRQDCCWARLSDVRVMIGNQYCNSVTKDQAKDKNTGWI